MDDFTEDGLQEIYGPEDVFGGDNGSIMEEPTVEPDSEMGVAGFGMALGLADEMSQETREMESLARRIQKEEESTEPISLLTRRRKAKDRPMNEFATYLDAVLNGEVDVEWAVFNRQGI